MYSIGIDIGTTNCKLCIFELQTLNLVDLHSFSTPKIVTQDGEDFDINLIFQKIESTLNYIFTSFKNVTDIKNIVVASVGESGVLVDENDETIGPAITWYDIRTKSMVEKIGQKFTDKQIYNITGLPIHSNYSVTKMLWIKEAYQIDLQKMKWLCVAEYIAYRLTGIMRSERSLASRTMLLDLNQQKWSKILENQLELGHVGSEFIDSGKNIAPLKSSFYPQDKSLNIMVSIGGHDHMCGAIAAGLKKGEILNSTGTTEGLLLLSEQSHLTDPFLASHVSNGIYVLNHLNTLYSSLPSAGYAIEWFRTKFSVTDDGFFQLLEQLQNKLTNIDYIRQQKNSIFIPHLRGSGPPNRNIFAKGLWYGFDENTTLEDTLFAIYKGLCFELRNLLNVIEDLTNSHHPVIKVIGAASKSPIWLQLKADILGRTVLSCNIKEAVCKGSVMLAGYQNGYITPSDTNQDIANATEYKPNPKVTSLYDEMFLRYYKSLYDFKSDLEQSKK